MGAPPPLDMVCRRLRGERSIYTRARRVKGQTVALERALAGEADCTAVLQQIASTRGAVNGSTKKVLENQLRDHQGQMWRNPATSGGS